MKNIVNRLLAGLSPFTAGAQASAEKKQKQQIEANWQAFVREFERQCAGSKDVMMLVILQGTVEQPVLWMYVNRQCGTHTMLVLAMGMKGGYDESRLGLAKQYHRVLRRKYDTMLSPFVEWSVTHHPLTTIPGLIVHS